MSLITGSASGIGLATARRFLARGDRLICLDVDRAGLQREFQGDENVWYADVDVVDDAAVRQCVETGVAFWGGLNNVVTAAGIGGGEGIVECDLEGLQRVVDVNLMGTIYAVRHAVPSIVESAGAGYVALISSTSARVVGRSSFPYPVSKAGVAAFGMAIAVELAPKGIRVNVVAPGPIRTAMTASPGARERLEHLVERIPLGRPGEPAEVAALIAFITSPDASYMTGAFIPVDGGLLAK